MGEEKRKKKKANFKQSKYKVIKQRKCTKTGGAGGECHSEKSSVEDVFTQKRKTGYFSPTKRRGRKQQSLFDHKGHWENQTTPMEKDGGRTGGSHLL